jgi:hypothetical protein
MYIKEQDYRYFENLSKEFDEKKKEKFMKLIREVAKKKTGKDVEKIKIIDDKFLMAQSIEDNEILTKTMIKKAYKLLKEEKIGENNN